MTRNPTTERIGGDGGATIVEFALVAPVLMLFAIGIMEYGLAWRQENLVQRGISVAGRTGSSMADNRFADYETLQSLASALNGAQRLTINRVITYKSTASNGQLPGSCDIAVSPSAIAVNGQPNLCNVYSGAMANTLNPIGFPAGSSTSPSCATGSWDINWCPTTRSRTLPDYFGLFVEVRYTTVTRITGANITMKKYVVYAIEPPTVGG